MEKKKCAGMSNSELKLYLETLANEYEAKKSKVIKICKEMEKIEYEYQNAERELRIRKNIYL